MIEEVKHYLANTGVYDLPICLKEDDTKAIWSRGAFLVKIEICLMNFFMKRANSQHGVHLFI